MSETDDLMTDCTQTFPAQLSAISRAYEEPSLFADKDASQALDKAVLESLGRRGLWDSVAALETVRAFFSLMRTSFIIYHTPSRKLH